MDFKKNSYIAVDRSLSFFKYFVVYDNYEGMFFYTNYSCATDFNKKGSPTGALGFEK